MFPPALLAFLGKNWLSVALGVVIAALLVYVGILKIEVGHYERASQKWEQAYNTIKSYYQTRETQLTDAAKQITAEHQDTLKRYNALVKERNKLLQERIKANEELKRVTLSAELISLWNASKRDPDSQESPDAKQGDDGGTSASKAVTLQDLYAVSAENDANHWSCIKQVHEWQTFWRKYSTAVEAVNVGST